MGRPSTYLGGESGHPRFLGARQWVAPSAPFQERASACPRSPATNRAPATAGAGRRYWFRWLMRPWRGIVPKKSQLGEDRCNFKPRRTDHNRGRASTNESRLKPLRRRFRTTENTENTEKENTQDAVKAVEEITHGDRQDQEIATRDSRLRAATFGSWPSLLVSVGCVAKTHREAERCVITSSTHPTGYRLISLRALRSTNVQNLRGVRRFPNA